MKRWIFLLLIIIGIPAVLVYSGAIFIIEETEYGVLTEFKKVVKSYDSPGPKFKLPFFQEIHRYPAKALTVDSPPENVVTGDQKKLFIDSYVKYKIEDPVKFRNSVQNIQRAKNRISIIAHNAIKDAVGNMNLQDIISKGRSNLGKEALKIAAIDGSTLGIKIIAIQIKRVTLPSANVKKAFERMKAERFKEAHYYRSKGLEESTIIRSQTDKEIEIMLSQAKQQAAFMRAEAELTADSIYQAAYSKDPKFFKYYRSLQALKVTLDTNTTVVLSPNSELFKYLVKPE